MAYTALYRKWRPDDFINVKGQDHIVTTLKNQITSDRVGHAYLFCGTRGTGKTTTAKILAKAVNCENPVEGSPCGECAVCKAIQAGTSMNVIEIDAASNNGVDSVREIRDEVQYSPTEGKYKVYIIDEVHMLSTAAFNALLKTLEEPPSYVIFILATTEVHKIPVTIVSRCQRYDFKRISIETITDRLNELLKAEGIEAEEKAVKYIAKAADGGMRDALSLLDQCVSFYFGQTLTYDKVLEVLGTVDTEVFSELLRAVAFNNITGALKIVEDIINSGRDLTQFVSDFIWYLRNLLLAASSDDDISDVIDMSSENMSRLKEESALIKADIIMRYIRVFSELANDIRYATAKRVLLEMAIIRLCTPAMENKDDSILDRIRHIETQLESGSFISSANAVKEEDVFEKPENAPELPKALTDDVKKAAAIWIDTIMPRFTGMAKSVLANAKITAKEDDKLLIVVTNETAKEAIMDEANYKEICDIIDSCVGAHVEIDITNLETNKRFDDYYINLSNVNFDITEE